MTELGIDHGIDHGIGIGIDIGIGMGIDHRGMKWMMIRVRWNAVDEMDELMVNISMGFESD